MPRAAGRACGFTLVELLVVVAIIATLIGLLLPAVQSAREAGRRVQCANHLKQVGLAVIQFHDQSRAYPMGRNVTTEFGQSWSFRLLPLLEEQAIFNALVPDTTVPMWDDRNAGAMRRPVSTYFCPSRRVPAADRDFDNSGQPPIKAGVAAAGDYAANPGTSLHYASGTTSPLDPKSAGPIHTYSRVRAAQVTDGLSKTFAVGERHVPKADQSIAVSIQQWAQGDTAFFAADSPYTCFRDPSRGLATSPDDLSRRKFGSMHPGVTQFVLLDGHVEPIEGEVDVTVLRSLCTIGDGGDPAAPPDTPDDGP